MPLLEIENLHVEIDGKEILKGLDLTVNAGEVHAIMGPNGSGKSTLAYVLAGKADYTPTKARCGSTARTCSRCSRTSAPPRGMFLAFQYPLEIPGVATMTFLRTALNAQRKKRGEAELSTPEFIKKVRDLADKLGIDQDMLRRAVNVGFSGGEKKRNEILQMALLEPRLAVLDETDSGLDIDALKIVADGVNRLRSPERSSSSSPITSGSRPTSCPTSCTFCRPAASCRTGGKELALELEARGYAEYQEEAALWRERAKLRLDQDRSGDRRWRKTSRRYAGGCPATTRWRRCARPPLSLRQERACRIAGSRSGNIPICAR